MNQFFRRLLRPDRVEIAPLPVAGEGGSAVGETANPEAPAPLSNPKTRAASTPETRPFVTAIAPGLAQPASTSSSSCAIHLTLSDFLPRIPDTYLQTGPHDGATPLEFEASLIGDSIAKGCTTIALAEIHQRLPQIFRKAMSEGDATQIRFPWEKVLTLTKMTAPGIEGAFAPTTVDLLGKKLRSFRVNPAAKAAAGESPKPAGSESLSAMPWYSRKGRSPMAFGPGAPLLAAPEGAMEMIEPTTPSEVVEPAPALEPAPIAVAEIAAPLPHIPPPPPTPPPVLPSIMISEEVAALRQKLTNEFEQCRQQQETQLAALAEGQGALRGQLEETLGKLQRARQEIEEQTQAFEMRTAGARETTPSLQQAQEAQSLEVEKLLAAGELRIAATEQERVILLRLRDYLQEMFRQVCFARNDLAKQSAEVEVKLRGYRAVEEQALAAEHQLAACSAERDALLHEVVAAKSECAAAREELAPLREKLAAAESANTDFRQRQEAFPAREAEVAAALASEQGLRQKAEASAAQTEADSQRALEELWKECERQQHEREATFKEESERLAASLAKTAGERDRLLAELAEARTAAEHRARTSFKLQAAIQQQRQKMQRVRRESARPRQGAPLIRKVKVAPVPIAAPVRTEAKRKQSVWQRLLGA